MSTIAVPQGRQAVIYPESDGLPMAENTKQFRWIVTIQGGLDALFREHANVFVAGDLLWYPVEGDNTIRAAPDIMAVFGRPKRDRASYLQWLEDNIAPQVTFELVAPGFCAGELTNKFKFYERNGVEEYYLWDPDNGDLNGWLRDHGRLKPIGNMHGWISPRLNVRFEVVDGDLHLIGPDNRKFATYVELVEQCEQLAKQREGERPVPSRAERLAAQLRALGIEPEA